MSLTVEGHGGLDTKTIKVKVNDSSDVEKFSDPLNGNHWQGTNKIEGFQFEGRFIGNPADRFTGTAKALDGSNITMEMTGSRER